MFELGGRLFLFGHVAPAVARGFLGRFLGRLLRGFLGRFLHWHVRSSFLKDRFEVWGWRFGVGRGS